MTDTATNPTTLSDVELIDQLLLAEAAESAAKLAKKKLGNELLNRKAGQIKFAYSEKPEPFGVVNLSVAEKNIKLDTVKKVEWEQSELEKLWKKIEADGADPKQYINVVYSVSETLYKTFGDNLRAYFDPARTVRAGSTSIKISEKEE